MFGPKDKKPSSLSRYVDPTGELTNRQLLFSEWYVKHQQLLGRIGLGCLIVFCVLTIGYSLFAWGHYFIFGYVEDQRQLYEQRASFPNYTAMQSSYGAQELIVMDTDISEGAPGKFDFATRMKNPNDDFVATITYRYEWNGGETEEKKDILLPGDERPVVLFGYAGDSPSNARISVQQIDWRRVNPHVVPDARAYISERIQFPVENVTYLQADGLNDIPAHQITFDVKNQSAYSYWQGVFYIEFLENDVPTGVAYLALDRFRAGETRAVDIRSVAPTLSVTDVRLHPVINVFDPDVFLRPGA